MKGVLVNIIDIFIFKTGGPRIFGGLHLCAAAVTAALAICAAVLLSRRFRAGGVNSPSDAADSTGFIATLTAFGWVLVVLEAVKQLLLYFKINDGAFDWWYFPFQLCSVPMYLCILLPFVHRTFRKTFYTFIGGYTSISAAAALIYPEDFLRREGLLTAHGFLWHGILLFLGLLILITGAADSRGKGICSAFGLYAFFCMTAVLFNMATVPIIQPGLPHKYASMFYLDPYHPSVQPLVGAVQKGIGIPAGLVLYALAIAAVSSVVILLSQRIRSASSENHTA